SPEGVISKIYIPEGLTHIGPNGKAIGPFPNGTLEHMSAALPKVHGDWESLSILPKAYLQRKMNRGFEAVARDGDSVFAFMQGPLKARKHQEEQQVCETHEVRRKPKKSPFARIVAV